MNGETELDDMISSLQALANLGPEAAKQCASLVESALKTTAAAGLTPEGKPWKAKKDGGRPMSHAAEHIGARVNGVVIIVEVKGPDAIHNFGTSKLPMRQIIPRTGEIPKLLATAITEGARAAFNAITSRGQL